MRASRGRRLARGSAAASIATFTALVSHVTAGADVPHLAGIIVPLILSVAVCTLLAGRSLSVVRLSLSVLVSQALFHALFILGTAETAAHATAQMPPGHDHAAMLAALPTVTGHLAHPSGDAAMWAGHAIAAVATIIAIRHGERSLLTGLAAVMSIRQALWRLVHVFVVAVVEQVPAPTVPAHHHIPAPRSAVPLRLLRWRGPPLLSVC